MNPMLISANIAANQNIQGLDTCDRNRRQDCNDAGAVGETNFAKIFDNAKSARNSGGSADSSAVEASDTDVQTDTSGAEVPDADAQTDVSAVEASDTDAQTDTSAVKVSGTVAQPYTSAVELPDTAAKADNSSVNAPDIASQPSASTVEGSVKDSQADTSAVEVPDTDIQTDTSAIEASVIASQASASAVEAPDAAVQLDFTSEELSGTSLVEGMGTETEEDVDIKVFEDEPGAGLALGHILKQTRDRSLIRQYIQAAFLNRERVQQGVSADQTVQVADAGVGFEKSNGMHLAVGQIFRQLRTGQIEVEGDKNLSLQQTKPFSKSQTETGGIHIQSRSALSDIQTLAVENSLNADSDSQASCGDVQDIDVHSLWQATTVDEDSVKVNQFLLQKHLKSYRVHAVKEGIDGAQKNPQTIENVSENLNANQIQIAAGEENLPDGISGRFEETLVFRGSDNSDTLGKISNLATNAEKPFAVAAQNQTQNLNPEYSLLRSQQIVEQVLANSQQIFNQGSGRMKLVLNPPDLGTVDMDVRLRNQKVEVIMVTAKAEVQQALQSHADQIKSAFQAQGLQVDSFDVLCFSDSDSRSFEGNAFMGRGGRKDSEAGQRTGGESSREILRKPIQMTNDSGISVFA